VTRAVDCWGCELNVMGGCREPGGKGITESSLTGANDGYKRAAMCYV
jgi:hypothetical protein